MKSTSRNIASNQEGIHEDLEKIVRRHLDHEFKKPVAEHNAKAYAKAIAQVNRAALIFDSGCGNGNSTLALAKQFPEAYIIGIDKSACRIGKQATTSISASDTMLICGNNYCIVRADLLDFWRLASNDNIKLLRHFILYPNPWPKKHHFQRRWHGSPVYRQILSLGGALELRSNWPIYLQEFAAALALSGYHCEPHKLDIDPARPISDFESKYHDSGHTLWQLKVNLDIDST